MASITLTTPEHGFAEVKIIQMRAGLRRNKMFLTFQYGDTVGGVWTASPLSVVEKLVEDLEQLVDGEQEIRAADPQYTDLIAAAFPSVTFDDMSADPSWVQVTIAHPTHGDLVAFIQRTYVASAENLYQHALDQGWFVGALG